MYDDLLKSQEKNAKEQKKVKDQNAQLERDNDKVSNLITDSANKCEQLRIDLKSQVTANKKQAKSLDDKTSKMNEIIKEANEQKRVSKGYEKERQLLRDTVDQKVLMH